MNKNYSKKRPRGRPKKRRGKEKVPKPKKRERDEEEESKEVDAVANEKPQEKKIKEEVRDEDEEKEKEEEESLPPLTLPIESSASTSSAPQEAVVAQLNQLQESVVSHILQYQAGVMAQFQQLQQQMLSELNSSNQPQVTVTPLVKTEPNERKRRASAMTTLSSKFEEGNKNVDMQFKRKRTAFSERQYQVLETTFVHNNFPEPIDQHCIALRIKTPYRSIKMWFQNRRASIRKRMTNKEKAIESAENKTIKNNSDPDTRWYCSLCPSTFISKKFLNIHSEAHQKETLHCPNCNMAFTHKVLLDTHKISKCTSKTGVDLSHLEEESKDITQDKISLIKSLNKEPSSSDSTATAMPSPLPLLLLKKMQKQQQQLQQTKQECNVSPPPPPLVDPSSLSPLSNHQQENSLYLQQQRLMQQLLLAQLQQAAQVKAKEQIEKPEEEEEETSKDLENQNGSLTLGGLTIFPVKSSKVDEVKIKEEFKQPLPEDVQDSPPSTLQDQITSILQSQGLKSAWKSAGIKEEDCDSKIGTRESMKEQIEAILRHQEEQRKKSLKISSSATQNWDESDLDNLKRHRRRTTVFNEVQLRTLYMHFTHCNFPDPAMFKIIGHLIKLDPQVIKIWFQNERSRQRKRATHIVDEVSSKDKPYKCRDCGMSFAMLTFLVKHSMRHNGETDQDSSVRTCPLCLQKWNKEVFSSHLKSRHNVNLSLVEERSEGSLKCYLCSEKFPDQENLMIHKHKHLKDEYGDPPQCSQCKTTFVNAICLEAHMETHDTAEWSQKCNLCEALFHDKMLLMSHKMGHGVPLAPVSTIDRSRSQLQHSSVRAINALARKTVASAIESLNKSSSEDNIELFSDSESLLSERGILSIKTTMSSPSAVSDQAISKDVSPKSTTSTSTIPTLITSPTISPAPVNNSQLTSSTAPVSYVKLIPVQLIPTNPLPNSQAGSNASGQNPAAPIITTPTTAFISVPVSLVGSNETACNPILNHLLDSSAALTLVDDKGAKKKTLPNLIPINLSTTPVSSNDKDAKLTDPDRGDKEKVPDSATTSAESKLCADTVATIKKEDPNKNIELVSTCEEEEEEASAQGNKIINDILENEDKAISEELSAPQKGKKKRYVPILPLPVMPVQVRNKERKLAPANPTPETPVPQRPKSSRNVPNKRLWESFRMDGYKRRRTPTYFSGSQREILEAHFDHDNFPDPGEQVVIADQLSVDYAVVKTWFQNTRKNFRKQMVGGKTRGAGGPFHCQKCNVAYISESSLNEHMEVHSIVTGIRCQECDLNFVHQNVLKTHHTVCHKNAKVGDSIRRKKYGVDILDRFSSSQAHYDGDNEEASDTDSQDEGNDESVKNKFTGMGISVKTEKVTEDTFEDGEDYHPIMAVECILDNSDEDEVQKTSALLEQSGHKCSSCGESFASLIALKEHNSRHCANQELKPGHFRRRRKLMGGKGRLKIGNNIRCFDCYSIFSDRNSYLEHFGAFPCNSGRQRIEYTDEEQKVLLTHYDGNNFPLPSEMSLLARRLGVRYRQIMHWFQNRRSKERKKMKEGGRFPPVECQRCKASFVREENLKRHRKIVHGEVSSTPITEHACKAPGCGAFFPNAELLLTHGLAHQIDSDAMQLEEESNSHKLPNLGPTSLWKDFAVLEAHYSDNNFPDPMDIGFIARRLQVDPLHVHMWFKERRNQHIRKLEENGRKVMEGETAVSTQKALSKVCSKCNAAFICQTDLDSHKDMHKSSRAQVCSMCGLEFSNVVVLETHWIRHGIEVSKEKQQSPERATKASFSTTQMHVLDTHYENNNFPIALEIWLIAVRLNLRPRQVTHWFQNRRGRDRRLQKISTPYSRICGRCGASFICDLFLNNHLKDHKKECRYPCTECSAVFLSSVLQETHTLYHTSIPKDKTLLARKNTDHDGARDPMTEGQIKDNEEEMDDRSDTSEGELKIDESEGYAICIENNENSDMEEDDIEGTLEDVDELPDAEYEPSIEENSLEETIVQENSLEETIVEENSVEETIVEENSLEETIVEENSLEETIVEENSLEETIIDEMVTDAHLAPQNNTANKAESQSATEKTLDNTLADSVNNRKSIREEVFFDNTDSDDDDDDEDEPRLRIVSAYTISGDPEDIELEEDL